MKLRNLLIAILISVMLTGCAANKHAYQENSYEYTKFSSTIEQAQCALCGEHPEFHSAWYIGQDNLGLVNVNTFDIFLIEINRYDDSGNQIMTEAGYMNMGGSELGGSRINAMTDPDRGISHIDITPIGNGIDKAAIEGFLCQDCLDEFASHCFVDDSPCEVAVINFSTKTLRPLLKSCPWYTEDNYSVMCDYNEQGGIDLTVHYAPPRFSEE